MPKDILELLGETKDQKLPLSDRVSACTCIVRVINSGVLSRGEGLAVLQNIPADIYTAYQSGRS